MFKKYKWLEKFGVIIIVVIIALIAVPSLLQWLMIDVFSHARGGSNDGWLGFWGGYLGAVIAVAGVYWSVNEQHQETIESEKRACRPRLRSTCQYGLHGGDTVYHSIETVKETEIPKPHFRLENVVKNPAIDILFVAYDMQGSIADIVSIPSIKEKAVIVHCRKPMNELSRITIVFMTLRDEYGSYIEIFSKDGKYSPPKMSWGAEAEGLYESVKNSFDYNNQNANFYDSNFFAQYISVFSEDDVNDYLKSKRS